MEDQKSFSERVKKTFGSLFTSLQPSPSPASLSNPLWSLSGALVEKKEWRRDKDSSSRDSNPCSSSFDEFLSRARRDSRHNLKSYRKELDDDDDLKDLDDDDDGGGDGGRDDFDDWDVKDGIGLDSTLDNEEEEDTFDKVALGRENAGDRLYMSDVKAGRGSLNISLDDLPGAVESMERDPRANRLAARIRLKEDDEEAASKTQDLKSKQPPSSSENTSAMPSESHDNVKPILKRKDNESTSKASKRVRFDPAFISKDEGAGEDVKTSLDTINQVNDDESILNEKVSRVPDCVRNPSNYTCYSLDSTDETIDKSELVMEENSKSEYDLDIPADLKKSVTFVPKKKSDASTGLDSDMDQVKDRDAKRPSLPLTFLDVASEEQETVVGDMEVDDPEKVAEPDDGIMLRKQDRQYRAKPQDDEPV